VVIVDALFSIALTGFGSVGLFWSVRELIRSWASRRWPIGSAEIDTSVVSERKGRRGRTEFEPTITYTYSFEGRTYVGHRIAFGDIGTTNRQYAEEQANRFAVGTRWEVSICGRNPDVSVLHPGPNRRVWYAVAFFCVYVAMALSFLVGALRGVIA
jgi:Protein of unknown function (DUF3592)